MPKQEQPLVKLGDYLPGNCSDDVIDLLKQFKVQLTITRSRQSILGDYRHAHGALGHRISVNGNLNKFAFLITLLHELAHLFTFEHYGPRVQSHGKEWKDEFSKLLARFMVKKIFPPDIERALMNTLRNPSASSCGDDKLLRVLHQYDVKPPGVRLVEQIEEGALFSVKGGRVFKRLEKLRKRYKCVEVATGKLFLFSPVYEVNG